jgi:hypothetical protein
MRGRCKGRKDLAMTDAVTETVNFEVTVNASEQDGHWVARTLETAIFAHADTREEAVRSAGDANALIVGEVTRQGMEALVRFMEKYGIEYSIGESKPVGKRRPERMTRAA